MYNKMAQYRFRAIIFFDIDHISLFKNCQYIPSLNDHVYNLLNAKIMEKFVCKYKNNKKKCCVELSSCNILITHITSSHTKIYRQFYFLFIYFIFTN